MLRPLKHNDDIGEIERNLADVRAEDFQGPFASDIDRSPVRRSGTDRLAQNITASMLRYVRLLIAEGRMADARDALAAAERFDSGIRASGGFEAEFDSLREELGAII
jgi:hypothetical protein